MTAAVRGDEVARKEKNADFPPHCAPPTGPYSWSLCTEMRFLLAAQVLFLCHMGAVLCWGQVWERTEREKVRILSTFFCSQALAVWAENWVSLGG